MKTLNLIQGSDTWHQARLEHFTASEAPQMMSDSKYASRNDLLKLKKTGVAPDVSAHQQAIFDKGHAAEASIRPHVEELIGEELYPVTGLSDEHSHLLASFDGLTLAEDIAFEHKLWNAALAENVRNGVLDPHYIWQLEQQLLVAKAEKAIFVVSDGTPEKMVYMWYYPQEGFAQKLLNGWVQFKKDLDAYEIEVKAEVIEATVSDLPALQASVDGTEISTNIQTVIDQVKDFAAAEMAKPLETDLDFANKEALVKKVKAARDTLKAKVADIRNGFGSFEEFSSAAEELDGILQKLQSASEKSVKTEKENRKNELINKAEAAYEQYVDPKIDAFRESAPQARYSVIPGSIHSLLKDAVKGKRNLDSMKSACDDVVAKRKIDFDEHLNTVQARWEALKESAGDYLSQVGDISTILQMEVDHLKLHVGNVVNEIKQAEQERLAAQQTEVAPANEELESLEANTIPLDAPAPESDTPDPLGKYLFEQFGIPGYTAAVLSKALRENKIPGISVTVNQSAA